MDGFIVRYNLILVLPRKFSVRALDQHRNLLIFHGIARSELPTTQGLVSLISAAYIHDRGQTREMLAQLS